MPSASTKHENSDGNYSSFAAISSVATKMVPVWDKIKLTKSQNQKTIKSKRIQNNLSQSSPRDVFTGETNVSTIIPNAPKSAPRNSGSGHKSSHDHQMSPNIANRKITKKDKKEKPCSYGLIEKGTIVRNSWLVFYLLALENIFVR